jgi:acyl transferase domain-containing protein
MDTFLPFLNKNRTSLDSVAYTLQKKRVPFPYRDFLILSPGGKLSAETLKHRTAAVQVRQRELSFLFTGQGSQYPQMGRGLYEAIPSVRTTMDKCFSYLKKERGLDLKQIIFPNEEDLSESELKLMQTTYTQPSLFILEYAIASYLMELGIMPTYFLGHSLGEYTAACLSGVFSLEETLTLVADRGRIMQKARKGSMISIALSHEEIEPFLNSEMQISVINTPNRCVVSGTD